MRAMQFPAIRTWAARVATVLLTAGIATGPGPDKAAAQSALDSGSVLAPLPEPPTVNDARARLGRMLYFDTRLSGDTAIACVTCHDPARGWADGQALADGYTGVLYFRNAPSLLNAASRAYFMWDGRLDGGDLGTVVRDSLTEAHTMNMDSRLAQERLKQIPEYMALFDEAYGAEPYGGRIYGAIGEFLKTIRTTNAPFDAYLRGDNGALSDQARRGLDLFAGKAGCVACHSGPTLSDGGLHALGVPDNPAIDGDAARQIAMLRHFATMGTPNYMNLRRDVGHYVVTKDPADIGRFVTPSLWDVGQTAPYMHSGVFATLDEVVAFYDSGAGDGSGLSPLGLSQSERADLVAFLQSLTGDPPDESIPDLPDYQLRELGVN